MFCVPFLLGHKILVTELMAKLCVHARTHKHKVHVHTHTHTHAHTHTHNIFILEDIGHVTIFDLFQYVLKSHSILRTSVTDVLQY